MRLSDLAVTHGTVRANGLNFHYVEKGEGPLVVLLHGFPEFWWSWRYQLQALADAGLRAVAVDLRGYNETDKQGPYDLDTLATDVAEFIRALGAQKARIVSHDWGGAIGWHLAAHRPERVERLAVLNCPHPAKMTRALRSSPRQIKNSWYVFAFQVPFLPERRLTEKDAVNLRRMYRGMAKDRTHFSDEEIAPFREQIQKPGVASASIGYYRAAARSAIRDAFSRRETPKIHLPVMLGWAMDDQALDFDALVPGTEKYATDFRLETISHCGHFVHQEQPEAVNAMLVKFLKE